MAVIADSSNAYLSQNTASGYFATRLHCTAWTEASEDEQNKALIQASRIFDGHLLWADEPPDKTDPPQEVQDACCEMALVLLQGDTQVRDEMEGMQSLGLKGISISRSRQRKNVIPGHVYALLCHLATMKSGTSIDLVRG